MIYIYHFDIAAIILTLAILFLFAIRKNYPTRNSGIFLSMLILILVAGISDVISCFTISYPENVPLVLNYIINIVFLLSLCLSNVCYYFYVASILKNSRLKKWEKNLGILITVTVAGLLLTTPFTHLIFYFDENLFYSAGPLKIILYLISIVFLFFGLGKFLTNKKSLNVFQRITIVSYNVLVTAAILVQYFYPRLLIIIFVSFVGILKVYLSLENRLDYMF